MSMKLSLLDEIEQLAEKAANAKDGHTAMQFAQAVLSLAHANQLIGTWGYDPNQKSSTLTLAVRETTEGGLAVEEPFLAFQVDGSSWFDVDHFLESVEYFKENNEHYLKVVTNTTGG